MRNIEIKAKVFNLQDLLNKARAIARTEPTIIKQHDTFYNIPKGRFKLRRLLETGMGQLVFYERPDIEGPKLSTFEVAEVAPDNVSSLNSVLSKALGQKNDVKKVRHLFLIGQTRVHIDQVENLGDFMELEVCLRPEQSPEDGEVIAHEIMEKLGIDKTDLINGAYADLLEKSSEKS